MALVLLFPFLFMAPKPGIQIQPRSSILEKMPMIFGKRGVPVFSSQLELSSSRLSQLQDSVESAADYQASQLSDENKDESNEDLDLRPHTGAVMRSTSDYQRLCVKLSDLLMIFLSICGKDSGGITSDGRSEKGENPAAADSEELTDGASSPASDQDWLDAGARVKDTLNEKAFWGGCHPFSGSVMLRRPTAKTVSAGCQCCLGSVVMRAPTTASTTTMTKAPKKHRSIYIILQT